MTSSTATKLPLSSLPPTDFLLSPPLLLALYSLIPRCARLGAFPQPSRPPLIIGSQRTLLLAARYGVAALGTPPLLVHFPPVTFGRASSIHLSASLPFRASLAMTRIDWPFRPSSATIPMHLSLLFDGFGDEKAMRNFKVIMLAGQWLEALRTRR